MELTGGRLWLSFVLPEELLDNQNIDIRLETDNSSGSFTLSGFRIYGVPMKASMARAYEYARMVKAIGADDVYYPNLEQMATWNAADVEIVIAALRAKLQAAMAEKALSTVADFGSKPEWEGLEAYTVAVIDEKLIRAFYNEDAIDFPHAADETVYPYEIVNNSLHMRDPIKAYRGVISLGKRAGTFFLLDKPLKDFRFRASLDQKDIPKSMLSSVFFDIAPQNYLWMDIEIFTQYQEEVALDLPESWLGKDVFLYRAQDEELVFWAEKTAADGAIHIQPASGRYLMLDEPLESFAKQAEWEQKEIADSLRIQALEEQRHAKMKRTLIMIGCSAIAAVAAGAVGAILYLRKRK